MIHYLQIFSITDHAQALHGRYQGPYKGLNAELQTSQCDETKITISSNTQTQAGLIDAQNFQSAQVVLAYRHSDTGVLSGTSETLFAIHETPWEQMPGLSVTKEGQRLFVKLWSQEMELTTGETYRVHFGKTVAYLKYFGPKETVTFTDHVLKNGPAHLHTEPVTQEISIAPDTGSGIQIKMGQEIQNP